MEATPQPATAVDDRVDMVNLVRRHAHDVRNYINCIDLEAALLEELITDADAMDSVRRMRSQLTQLEATMLSLSVKFADSQPITLSAGDLLQLWKHQIHPVDECWQRVQWSEPAESKNLTIDSQAILSVLRELLVRAARRTVGGSLHASVQTTDATVIAELREPGEQAFEAEDWLPELERLATRSGGRLQRERPPPPDEWTTTLTFPVAGR